MSSSTNAAPAVRVAQVSKTFRTGRGAQVHALEDIDPQWPAAHFDVALEKARLAAS